MATWHQQKAGLFGLYAKPAKGYKCVTNPPNEFASAVCFNRKRDAEKFARRVRHTIIISAKG